MPHWKKKQIGDRNASQYKKTEMFSECFESINLGVIGSTG